MLVRMFQFDARILTVALLIGSLAGCNLPKSGMSMAVIQDQKDGLYYLERDRTLFSGTLKYRMPNNYICEANFKEGQRHGLVAEWYPNNQQRGESYYENDKLDGVFKQWYMDGQIKIFRMYDKGRIIRSQRWGPKGKQVVLTDWNADGTKK